MDAEAFGEPYLCKFRIVIDTNESAPFQFLGLKGNSKQGKRPIVVQTVRKAMYRMHCRPVEVEKVRLENVGLADYSIEGMEELIQVERKSVSDLFQTLGQRRHKFECEIKRLHEDCEFAAVLVEGDFPQIMSWRGGGPRPASVLGTMIAWQQRYPGVHWILAPSRAMAEKLCFRQLERFYEDKTAKARQPHGN